MSKVVSSSTPLASAGGVKIDTSLMSTRNCNVKNSRAVAYIVMHYTGNKGPDTARANAGYFRTTKTQASAHYVVDDTHIFQCIALKNTAWHCGTSGPYYNACRNATSFGVEMCCTAGNYMVGERTIELAAQLTAALCRLIGVSGSAVDTYVVRHWDVTRKSCPAQMAGKNNAAWLAFLARVKAILNGDKEVDTVSKTSITGIATATAAQMVAYIKSVNPSVPQRVIDMIPLYLSEGKAEDIRGDLAFAQSCLETGNFTFKGSAVTLDQNNFCGMGVTRNGMKGNSFATPQLGIRAQIQHLKAYANKEALLNPCVDPRFKYVTRGCIPYIEVLGIQENPQRNGWSAGKNYGHQILDILSRILKMPDTTKQDDNLLRLGDRGDAVKLLQHRLNLVGAILQEDGDWGPLTDTAVRNYQYKAGLVVDGIVGPKTQAKLIQDAITARAESLAAYLVKNKWHYKGNGYTAKATFSATKKLSKPGCSCAHFVSWVLQDVGLLQDKVLSHSKAGYGTGAKAIVNRDKLIGCAVTYPNKKIGSCGLQPGDVIIHDSSIGIYAPKNGKTRVLTGREGQPIDSKKRYINLAVTSGYEWKHNVLAVVRTKV